MNKEDVDFVESCEDIEKLRAFVADKRTESIAWNRTMERISHLRHIESTEKQNKSNELAIAILVLTIGLFVLTLFLIFAEFGIFQ